MHLSNVRRMSMAADTEICVTVVWSSGPRHVQEESLRLATGCTVLQALHALQVGSGMRRADAFPTSPVLGVWGDKVDGNQVLKDGDRLELYRPLRVDPKVARRARFESQGARATGLFAHRRAGAKAGY